MTETTAFLMKDLVLLAASFYLLRQDLLRSVASRGPYAVQRASAERVGHFQSQALHRSTVHCDAFGVG